jgi:hypothetical protein
MTEINVRTATGDTIVIRETVGGDTIVICERPEDGLIWSCANCNSPAGIHSPRCPTLRPGERNAPAAPRHAAR